MLARATPKAHRRPWRAVLRRWGVRDALPAALGLLVLAVGARPVLAQSVEPPAASALDRSGSHHSLSASRFGQCLCQ